MIAGIPGIGIGMLLYVVLVPIMLLIAITRLLRRKADAAMSLGVFVRSLAIVTLIGLGFWLQIELALAAVRASSYFYPAPFSADDAAKTISGFVVFLPFLPIFILAVLVILLQIARSLVLRSDRAAATPEPSPPSGAPAATQSRDSSTMPAS